MSLRSFYPLLCFVLQSCLHYHAAFGYPVASNASSGHEYLLTTRDTYPSLDEIKKAFNHTLRTFVFTTQFEDDNKTAYQFAKEVGGVVLRDAYPPGYLRKRSDSDSDYQTFIDHASRVYAGEARGNAYLVANWEYAVDACRTFNRIVLPELFYEENEMVATKICGLYLVDSTDTTNRRRIFPFAPFERSSGWRTVDFPKGFTHVRGPEKDDPRCYDWNGYGEDPSSPDFHPESWQPYMPGVCGVHVVQYQRNEKEVNPSPNYKLNVTVVDSRGQTMGQADFADALNDVPVEVKSKLPKVLSVRALSQDSNPILFNYDGHKWNSDAKDCKVGKYDKGKREMDCGFECK